MTKLIYPTLDLFLYDLREGLGQTEAEVTENRQNFQHKLLQTIDEQHFIQLDEHAFEPEYVELLGAQRHSDFESDIHEGYYYPVRLSDTYGLLLDCSVKAAQPETDLTWLNKLRVSVNDKLNDQTGTLGQTWMLSAQVHNVPAAEQETIAKRCYETLIPGADFADNKPRQSAFLGGCLFEFWRYASPEQTTLSKNHHMIIVLYPITRPPLPPPPPPPPEPPPGITRIRCVY